MDNSDLFILGGANPTDVHVSSTNSLIVIAIIVALSILSYYLYVKDITPKLGLEVLLGIYVLVFGIISSSLNSQVLSIGCLNAVVILVAINAIGHCTIIDTYSEHALLNHKHIKLKMELILTGLMFTNVVLLFIIIHLLTGDIFSYLGYVYRSITNIVL